MFNLQLLNSQQYLLYLVCFGLSFMILYVDPRVSLPWRLVNMMTSGLLSRQTKKMKVIDPILAPMLKVHYGVNKLL